jgi:hypothetical protein
MFGWLVVKLKLRPFYELQNKRNFWGKFNLTGSFLKYVGKGRQNLDKEELRI